VTAWALRALPGVTAGLDRPRFEWAADVVVVGTGAAGMSAALEAAGSGLDVLVVTKSSLGGGSTPWAQGGLAAVLDPEDSLVLHASDTMTAGAGLGRAEAIDVLVGAAPAEIARLTALGAHFDPGPLGLEGGHSRHRIVHAGGDASGAEVHRVLARATTVAVADGRLRLAEHVAALDVALDATGGVAGLVIGQASGPGGLLTVGIVRTATVVLATGGFGQAFATTTNPDGVTGDGTALAARVGAEMAGLEFVQFHPTVLWAPGGRGRRPLITEALRGAGATLVDCDGRSVMGGAHPRGDLAPRDVVSATMHRRMTTGDGPDTHLWLDATSVGREQLEREYPTVTAACRAAGCDPVVEPIPVAPGAHYACGGIRADMDGATSVDGLFAVGEVASTGVHGANRLASNSLTESLATGRRVGRRLVATHRRPNDPVTAGLGATGAAYAGHVPGPGSRAEPDPAAGAVGRVGSHPAAGAMGRLGSHPAAGAMGLAGVDPAARTGLADAMSAHAGVVRHGEGLEHLLDLLAAAPAAPGPLDMETVEATNLHTVSTLVALAATARTESRGCHRRSDFPHPDDTWTHDIVLRAVDGEVGIAVGADR
jgi:L-aspartate oxidase